MLAIALTLMTPMACNKPSAEEKPATAKDSNKSDKETDKSAGSTKETEVSPPADISNEVVQDTPFGSVGWTVANDGSVKADVRDSSGAPLADDVAGTLETGDGASAKTVVLEPVAGSTLFGATLPAFSSDLTPVTYAIKQGNVLANGTFFVPAGGSSVLTQPPPASAVAPPVTAATATPNVVAPSAANGFAVAGPHGGVVRWIGDKRVEIVADQTTGEVRAYLLDANNKSIPLGGRKLSLGVIGDHPELVNFEAVESGNYWAGTWGLKVDPRGLTIALRDGTTVHAGVLGLRVGSHRPSDKAQPVAVLGRARKPSTSTAPSWKRRPRPSSRSEPTDGRNILRSIASSSTPRMEDTTVTTSTRTATIPTAVRTPATRAMADMMAMTSAATTETKRRTKRRTRARAITTRARTSKLAK
jgi:hypothetical protein